MPTKIHQLNLKEQIMQTELQRIFIKLSEQYIRLFEQKHELTFEGWVGSQTHNIGEVAEFSNGSVYVDFNVIRKDIDNEMKPNIFRTWYDTGSKINYYTYFTINR